MALIEMTVCLAYSLSRKNMSEQQNLFKPRRVAAKIHYSMINQFMFVWVKWNHPCDLNVQHSRDREWLGVCFNVENNDTIDMMTELQRSLNIQILDL